MKGDMGGAACVIGLLHALAARKAKVNVVGVVGLVENMPDGDAIRARRHHQPRCPGRRSRSSIQTPRGASCWRTRSGTRRRNIAPRAIIDLATLTGAVMVALGHEMAGLFANNDELAQRLAAAGEASGEKVWRLPLGAAYDKLVDSKFADMKNAAGRSGGSITAAQFLQAISWETPWAHIDVAGTAMASPPSDINQSWGSGWGVRLAQPSNGQLLRGLGCSLTI